MRQRCTMRHEASCVRHHASRVKKVSTAGCKIKTPAAAEDRTAATFALNGVEIAAGLPGNFVIYRVRDPVRGLCRLRRSRRSVPICCHAQACAPHSVPLRPSTPASGTPARIQVEHTRSRYDQRVSARAPGLANSAENAGSHALGSDDLGGRRAVETPAAAASAAASEPRVQRHRPS